MQISMAMDLAPADSSAARVGKLQPLLDAGIQHVCSLWVYQEKNANETIQNSFRRDSRNPGEAHACAFAVLLVGSRKATPNRASSVVFVSEEREGGKKQELAPVGSPV